MLVVVTYQVGKSVFPHQILDGEEYPSGEKKYLLHLLHFAWNGR